MTSRIVDVQQTNLPEMFNNFDVSIKQLAQWLHGEGNGRRQGIHVVYFPCVQRDYVWNQRAIKQFFKSIYEGKYRGPGKCVTLSTITDNQTVKCRKTGEVNHQDIMNGTLVIDAQQRAGAISQCLYDIPCPNEEGRLVANFLLFNPITEVFSIDNRRVIKKLQLSMLDFWRDVNNAHLNAIEDYMTRNENHFSSQEEKIIARNNLEKLKTAFDTFEFSVTNENQTLEEAFELFYNINFYQKKVNEDSHYNAVFYMLDPEVADKLRRFYTNPNNGQRIFRLKKSLCQNVINMLSFLTYDTNPKKFKKTEDDDRNTLTRDVFTQSVEEFCNLETWDNYLSFFNFADPYFHAYNPTKVHYGYGLYLLGLRKGLNRQTLERYMRNWLELILLYNRYPKKRSLDKDLNKYYIRNGEFNMAGMKRFMDEANAYIERNLSQIEDSPDTKHSSNVIDKIYKIYVKLNRDNPEDMTDQQKFEYCWETYKRRWNLEF